MTLPLPVAIPRRKAVWGPKRTAAAMLVLWAVVPALAAPAAGKTLPGRPGASVKQYKLDDELDTRARGNPSQMTRVIVEVTPGAQLPPEFKRLSRRKLGIINGEVLEVPNGVLKQLAAHPSVFRVHYDRPAQAHNYRTGVTVGTRAARTYFGLTGAGVGVAVIDSGIASWHDDLTGATDASVFPYGDQRVMQFVDFVNGQSQPYDDNGHGTHVAGIIAGNGRDSVGRLAGVAPRARLVSLKVLDANGAGTISNIIAALDWVLANHARYNIRVVNLSAGAGVHESYWTDPLTLATKRVVDDGVVVVVAAGNQGKNALGQTQYGGITAPGNAPWVLTVGASSTMGTTTRTDDIVASFSSRGPTYLDWAAKPDLVAPGAGTVSLAAPGSTFYTNDVQYLVGTTTANGTMPYLVLSGTSMAAPVVTGTVALMMQANPNLTPNAVKGILEYTAQTYPGYNPLTQGAGFLNTMGAIRLSLFFKNGTPGSQIPTQGMWSKHVIWGNQMLSGGVILPSGNAWATNIVWGDAVTSSGDNIVWGETCVDCDNIVWGETLGVDNIVWGDYVSGDNIVWGESGALADNIVWGEDCGGADCENIVWGEVGPGNIVWGTANLGDNIVWGEAGTDNIVWGEAGTDNIVWGEADSDNIVWGESGDDNIVWGEAGTDNIVWGELGGDNIVWGESGENIIWGAVVDAGIYWRFVARGILPTDEQIFGLVAVTAPTFTTVTTPPDPMATTVTSDTSTATATATSTTTTDTSTATTSTTTSTTVSPTTTGGL